MDEWNGPNGKKDEAEIKPKQCNASDAKFLGRVSAVGGFYNIFPGYLKFANLTA